VEASIKPLIRKHGIGDVRRQHVPAAARVIRDWRRSHICPLEPRPSDLISAKTD